MATRAACKAWQGTPQRHATAVQRLVDAGALWLGKANMDQFATGLVGTRSPYGRPASVFDATRVSGGSSSGSAVAVARGHAAFALGTDTAGSGRVPAAFNALVGLKPTPGRVSTAGVLPACRSIDCVSLFAHTVDDAALLLALVEGDDAADDYSAFALGPARLPAPARIGVPLAPQFFGDAGYAPCFAAAVERARARGHAVVELDFAPLHEVAALLYEGPWVAERHSVVRELLASRPEAFDPAVRQVIERASRFGATDAFEAQYRLRRLQRALQALWQQVDVLMVPTAPGHPRFDEVDADPLGVNARLGTYTNFVNLLGWCALALPAGRSEAGLPFGLTFIAPAAHDAALVDFGRRWLDETPAPAALPQPASEPALPIAVVGAHLSGLPLNGQLIERGARLRECTRTTPQYRLHALPDTQPPKPGLQRCAEGGAAIEVEVWDMPLQNVGGFLSLVPPPLCLGSIELADGSRVHGFLCEAHALAGATDISRFGGWRAYLASR
jgi:allophanate hydrolase